MKNLDHIVLQAAEQAQQAEPVGWWYEMAVELDADGVPTEWVPHVQIRKPATLHHTKNIRPLIYGDAAPQAAVAVPDERAAFEEWLQENIDDTDTVRPSKEKVDAYFAVWMARAMLAAEQKGGA